MVDIIVTESAVKPTNARTRIEEGIAGSTITAGQAMYMDTNGKLHPALATSESLADVVGIALNNAAPDQPVDYVVQGDVTFNSVLVPATAYVLGGAAGKISPSADLTGSRLGTVLGMATSSTNLRVGIVPSRVSPSGTSSWSPSDLGTSLWAWYKSDTGVCSDTAGNTAATNGGTVARWNDLGLHGRYLTQSDSTKRPVFTTNALNGKPSVQFANDWLRASVTNAPGDDYSLFIVMKLTSLSDEVFVDCGRYQFYCLTDMMTVGHYWSESISTYWNGGLAQTGSVWRLHSVIVDRQAGNNADATLYLDGTSIYASSSANQSQAIDTNITVGASRHDTWVSPMMDVAEIIIMNSAATSTERQNVNDYIEARYGLVIA